MSNTASDRTPGRLASTGYAFAYMLLAIPSVALFCLEVTFIPLVIVTVGAFALQAVVPLVGGLADVHRRMASAILHEPVPSPYRSTAGRGLLGRLDLWMRDPGRWRDLLWLLVNLSVGWAMSIIAFVFFPAIVFYLIYPFLYAVTPEGVFDEAFGIFTIDTQGESFYVWTVAGLMFLCWWFMTPWLVHLKARMDANLLSNRTQRLEQRVEHLSETRAQTIDHSAAEIRRIERDLHDGAQARLVALGMSLGLADEMMANDPEAAKKLLYEARATTTAALGDLRSVVRGIHPPVLADRGLDGAVKALAIDMPIPVTVTVELDGRPPAPVESAAYFAVAECLANVGKHSRANTAWIRIGHSGSVLHLEVGDDGVGGLVAENGTGLRGVARRLASFDGKMETSSPDGGPTIVSMEVPCVLSSGRTTPSSGTA